MSEAKNAQSLANLGRALERLDEALKEPAENSLIIDGAIQRFEFVTELFWKTLKRLLEDEGVQASTPRDSIQQAFEAHWIEDESVWLQMLRDRNQASHVYNEAMARAIHARIKGYFPEMERTYHALKERGSR